MVPLDRALVHEYGRLDLATVGLLFSVNTTTNELLHLA